MAVSITTTPLNFRKIEKTLNINGLDNYVKFDYTIAIIGTGDATGGTVQATIDFSNLSSKHYISICRILCRQTSAMTKMLHGDSDAWEDLHIEDANENIVFWESYTSSLGIPQKNQLTKNLYLGKVNNRDANPGIVYFTWPTNNDTEIYNCLIQGFVSETPIPLCQIHQ